MSKTGYGLAALHPGADQMTGLAMVTQSDLHVGYDDASLPTYAARSWHSIDAWPSLSTAALSAAS